MNMESQEERILDEENLKKSKHYFMCPKEERTKEDYLVLLAFFRVSSVEQLS